MTDPLTRAVMLEAQVERVSLERDEARQMLAELGKENARLRANVAVLRQAVEENRSALLRVSGLAWGILPWVEGEYPEKHPAVRHARIIRSELQARCPSSEPTP